MAKDNRTFEEVVTSIVKAEDDVDKILQAARLERHESNTRLNAEQKKEVIGWAFLLIGFLAFICVFFLPMMLR